MTKREHKAKNKLKKLQVQCRRWDEGHKRIVDLYRDEICNISGEYLDLLHQFENYRKKTEDNVAGLVSGHQQTIEKLRVCQDLEDLDKRYITLLQSKLADLSIKFDWYKKEHNIDISKLFENRNLDFEVS